MNSRNNSYRGFGFYLVLILIVVGVWYFLDGNTTTNSYTRAAFEKDIQSGDVTAIDIVQNREIPTGSVNLTFSDSTQKVLIVSDVNEIVSYLQDQDITYYTMENVPAESWIMTLLPYLIIFGAMFIFFMIMTNQAAANAGGGSSKMMNFGKSRAKLMQPDAKSDICQCRRSERGKRGVGGDRGFPSCAAEIYRTRCKNPEGCPFSRTSWNR